MLLRTASLLCAAALSLTAHHDFDLEFDRDQPVSVAGTVTKVGWTNPHVWFCLETRDANGRVELWQFEGAPPAKLRRAGWNPLEPGQAITVEGFWARQRVQNGVNTAASSLVTLAGGRRLPSMDTLGWSGPQPFFNLGESRCK